MAYQILLVISPVITMPFLSRSLGVTGIGKYSYSYTMTSYFVLIATLGCDTYGRREISYVKDSILERSERFWSIQIVKCIATIFVFVIYIIFCIISDNTIILLILGIHLINVPLNIGWYYQGIEKFRTLTTRGFTLKLIDLLFVIIFIHKPDDLTLYVVGSSTIALVTFVILWYDLRKTIFKIPIRRLTIKKDLRNSLVFFLPSIATSIYTLLDKTMLGIFTGDYIENGYYEQALKINQVFLKIVLAFGTVLLPQIAYSYKQGKYSEVNEYINKSMRYVYFMAFPIAFGLCSISDLFVPWFFGNEFLKVSMILQISGFIILFQGMSDTIGMQYLVAIGKQKKYIISLFIGAISNFLCNLVLIHALQSIGATIASLISEAIIVSFQIIFVKNKLEVNKLIKTSRNYFVSAIVMFIITKVVANQLDASIINTVIVVILGGFCYFAFLFFIKDPLIIDVVKSTLLKKTSNK
ncbi:hypothetical protein BLA28_15435 [Eisenbergiella tayi]|uniref:Putative cell division protein YtgP n=1 Tax=Eisenbergiella tayi TaxID=1432052 RepID=A0A1E3ALF7_9FIRM|nr:flippase [Eisenbergiella tayi]ODM09563.1 putative cell division protein YtgP [Eisenbergiella tayi]OIZ63816.1 hypothetical protein BLA28_15435 [Eisenbergiella tayi]